MNVSQPNKHFEERNNFVVMLFEEHHEILFPRALSLCLQYKEDQSVADDLVQNVYMKALTSYPSVRRGYEQGGTNYLFRMLLNAMNDVKRQQKKEKRRKELYALTTSAATNPSHFSAELYFMQLQSTLRKILSPIDAAIMSLYLQGFTYQEIGSRQGMPKNTVGTRIHRAKKILKQFMD